MSVPFPENTNSLICKFEGEYRFLSNFWPAGVCDDCGIAYKSIEHAYQACKTEDVLIRYQVGAAETPGEAKKLGRRLVVRPNWDKMKVNIMFNLLEQKFILNTELGNKLLETGDAALIEGNWWNDRFWGCTWDDDYPGIWQGHNVLGKLLMSIRTVLQCEKL